MAMIRTHMPMSAPFVKAAYNPVDKYLSFFSIYQDWMMFSPNPSRVDSRLSAVVEFSNGKKINYEFPHASKDFIINHIHGEKFRKIISESIRRDDHHYLWPDTALFALRNVMKQTNYELSPLKVELYRHWDETPPLEQSFRPHSYTVSSMQSYKFYTHEVAR